MKKIEKQWEEFRTNVLPLEVPQAQLDSARVVFIAGATAVLAEIIAMGNDKEEIIEQFKSIKEGNIAFCKAKIEEQEQG